MPQKRTTSFRTNVGRPLTSRPHQETPSKRLKAALTRGLVLSLMMLASLAAAPVGAGVITDHPGTNCKCYPYTNGECASRIFYQFSYTHINNSNLPGDEISVICPLTRRTIHTKGTKVYVDVVHPDT